MQRDPQALKHALELILIPLLIECLYLLNLIYGDFNVNKIKAFFSSIGSFVGRFFTKHNMKAVAVTAERAVETGAKVASGDIQGAIQEGLETVDAAKSISVVQKETTGEWAARVQKQAQLVAQAKAELNAEEPTTSASSSTPALKLVTPSTESK